MDRKGLPGVCGPFLMTQQKPKRAIRERTVFTFSIFFNKEIKSMLVVTATANLTYSQIYQKFFSHIFL